MTLWPETLWPVTLWPVFLLPLGYQSVNKNSIGGTIGKILKKVIITFQKIKVFFFAHFSLWSPKGSKKNCLECDSGQSVTGQSVTSQSDTGQIVSPAKVSLPKVSFWPKCYSAKKISGIWKVAG